MIKLSGLLKSLIDCWKEIANIEELQRILFKQGDNEAELAEFIRNHRINSEANTERLK